MKKSLLSIAFVAFLYLFSSAQLPVSTVAENKNVVLEEFTGIYCQYCPDGHKKAQQLADDNPNDVVLVNIHVGGYADPGTSGDPDFRTSFGTLIKDQAQISGYPSGTVSRHVFPGLESNPGGTAMSRSNWTSAAGTIMGQSSYVNIAADASIDYTTRVLTVNVEAYYTANGPASNNITVALLQNNVEGPQSGASTWNPGQILPNGNYNHNHILRHFLTGQWGDVTTATTSGTTYTSTFTYTIPADLNGVVYEIFDLDVVVYIAEGQQEIITGNKAALTYVLPPGMSLTDLAASSNMTMPANYCDPNVTPEITVTNNSTAVVDTFEVDYVLDNGTPVTLTGGSLAAATSVTIAFPAIVLTDASHKIIYHVNVDNNAAVIDNVSENDETIPVFINTISAAAFATSHSEGFESYATLSDNINNAILINNDDENTFVLNSSSVSATQNLGGYGNSAQSWRMRFRSWAVGSEASLLFQNIDLSGSIGNGLRISYAYAQDNGTEKDKFEINVSKDCGATWTNVFREGGANLATAAPVPGNWFYPAVTEWDSANIDLGAFDGESTVMIEFKGTSDGGNNLYFDDIQISNTVDLSNPYVYSGINESEKTLFEAVELFPNPASNFAFVKLEMKESADVKVEVRNMLGQVVKVVSNGVLSAGSHSLSINTVDFGEGLYFVSVYTDEGYITKKLVVTR